MPRTDLKPPLGTPSRQRPGLSFSRDFGTTQVTVASPGGAASVAPERTLLRPGCRTGLKVVSVSGKGVIDAAPSR